MTPTQPDQALASVVVFFVGLALMLAAAASARQTQSQTAPTNAVIPDKDEAGAPHASAVVDSPEQTEQLLATNVPNNDEDETIGRGTPDTGVKTVLAVSERVRRIVERERYNVFLSHYGEEKHEFVSHLYHELAQAGVRVFVDFVDLPEYFIGASSSDALRAVAETASVGLFVVTPTFLKKRWPLGL